MRTSIKKILLPIIAHTGLLQLLKFFHGRKHIVLTFHRVLFPGRKNNFDTCPTVTVNNFELILNYVMRRYEIVSLQFLCENLNSSKRLLAITFDDGWRDNYTNAYSILKKYEIPATIFMTTGKIGSVLPFWQQRLGFIFQDVIKGSHSPKKITDIIGMAESTDINQELYFTIIEKWKSFPMEKIENKIAGFSFADNIAKDRLFLSVEEIQLMVNEGLVDFGSHTENHVILPNESLSKVKSELYESKKKLEDVIGKKIYMLSYPNGNVSRDIVQQAESIGYSIGCTTQVRCIGGKVDKMMLPRIDTEWDMLVIDDGRIDDNLFQWITR